MPESSILPKCCLIGESVAGNPTHFMVERALAAAELDWRFLTFEIDASRLAEALAGVDSLGIRGVLLLGGLREAAAAWRLNQTERARRTGSATCLAREAGGLVADDLVSEAAEEAIAERLPMAGARVLLLGAARVASSLADAALASGAARLLVADRNADAAARLAARLSAGFPGRHVGTVDWDGGSLDFDPGEGPSGDAGPELILCSACWAKSRDGEFAAAAADWLPSARLVVDARLSASRSPLAHAAAALGVPTVDGLELLARESAAAIHRWAGMRADRRVLREAGEEFLGV